ncbi:MAG TPA: hypothetical protein V6D17_00225 [Candidatus Obscuribacterales bacterium]
MQTAPDSKKNLALELFLVSFVSLYLELLVIRWLSGEVRFFTVFRTFPLVTCFIGLGLGCALSQDRLFRFTPLALLSTIVVTKFFALSGIRYYMFPSQTIYSWQTMGDVSIAQVLYFTVLVLLALAGPFLAMTFIGTRIGSLFNKLKPLTAYSINVSGAIIGSVAFAIISFLGWHPWALLIPALIPTGYYLHKEKTKLLANIVPLLLCAGMAAIPADNPLLCSTYWSPYQQLTVVPFRYYFPASWSNPDDPSIWIDGARPGKEFSDLLDRCHAININLGPYQSAADLSPSAVKIASISKPWGERFGIESRRYLLPYKLKPAGDVLIVGSGAGNDVAAALRNGAAHVDAVELDPVIIDIGKRLHPERPYDDARVSVICDDARHYFNLCKKTYDMVIMGGLNSQTVVGQGSSVRTDTYVHTRESIAHAMTLLKPDGLLMTSSYDTLPWLRDRVFCTVREAVGYSPLVLHDATKGTTVYWDTFVVGQAVKEGKLGAPGYPFLERKIDPAVKSRVVTDDWPYMYVTPVVVDWPYWFMMAMVMAIAVAAGKKVLFTKSEEGHGYWQMFCLGAAFLLMELKSIAQLSLLYGSTWLTSSIVIDVILLMVLGANFLVMRFQHKVWMRQHILYGLLMAFLLISFVQPAVDPGAATQGPALYGVYFLVTVVCLLPLFAASLIFASSLGKVANPSRALAFNLFGAVVGGLLEYASNYTGIRSLVLIAALIYGASYLAYLKEQRKGKELEIPNIAMSTK